MPLPGFASLCPPTAPKIVSSENGRSHIAINRASKQVTHYHIDGVVLKQGKKCDYLLLDETGKIAYLIELKGEALEEAALQLDLNPWNSWIEMSAGPCSARVSVVSFISPNG